jgi:hypothetical protein
MRSLQALEGNFASACYSYLFRGMTHAFMVHFRGTLLGQPEALRPFDYLIFSFFSLRLITLLAIDNWLAGDFSIAAVFFFFFQLIGNEFCWFVGLIGFLSILIIHILWSAYAHTLAKGYHVSVFVNSIPCILEHQPF